MGLYALEDGQLLSGLDVALLLVAGQIRRHPKLQDGVTNSCMTDENLLDYLRDLHYLGIPLDDLMKEVIIGEEWCQGHWEQLDSESQLLWKNFMQGEK